MKFCTGRDVGWLDLDVQPRARLHRRSTYYHRQSRHIDRPFGLTTAMPGQGSGGRANWCGRYGDKATAGRRIVRPSTLRWAPAGRSGDHRTVGAHDALLPTGVDASRRTHVTDSRVRCGSWVMGPSAHEAAHADAHHARKRAAAVPEGDLSSQTDTSTIATC